MIVLLIGYIVISGLIGVLFLLSSILHQRFFKKMNMTYILSAMSLLVVLLLRVFYKGEFLIWGSWANFDGLNIVFKMMIAAIPAAVLICFANPKKRNNSLKTEILTGMAMEIPMRALVQNLFVVFGATSVVFGSVTNSILFSAIIWVQFIIVQELMMKRSINSKVFLESLASIWFSIWVGVIYITTGSIIIAMITHGLERWIFYMIRRSKIIDKEMKTSV